MDFLVLIVIFILALVFTDAHALPLPSTPASPSNAAANVRLYYSSLYLTLLTGSYYRTRPILRGHSPSVPITK